MNEDEAFIRAIVDSPGDDLPRLVYADWLDDRDDPRGTYLRAETEWAKPWQNGERSGDNLALRKLAAGFDPVWVARVSRPPVGVCCEHIKITGSAPPVDAEAINETETRLRLVLPPDYRAFLLCSNGGMPEPRYYWPTDSRYQHERWVAVERFFSVTKQKSKGKSARGDSNRDLEEATKVLNNGYVSRSADRAAREAWEEGKRQYVALAKPFGLGVVAIGLTGKRSGKVYEVSRILLAGSGPPRLLSPSLSVFLTLFRPCTD